MEPRKLGAAEIVPCLGRALATRTPQDRPDEPGAEPLWAPLLGRNFDAFLLGGRPERRGDESGSALCKPGWPRLRGGAFNGFARGRGHEVRTVMNTIERLPSFGLLLSLSRRLVPLIHQIATYLATCRDYYVAAISYEELSRRPEMKRYRADLARFLCETHDGRGILGRVDGSNPLPSHAWRIVMKKTLAALTAVALFAPLALSAQEHATKNGSDLKWAAGPPTLPPGAQVAVVLGDPSKDGLYVIRLKFPAAYKIPPHTHPNDEHVTVITGTFHFGIGAKLDETKGAMLKAGGFAHAAKGMQHYAWTSEETIVQVHGQGPQGIAYVDPANDPRRR